jgi:poly(3-hydroxybutyrate) depolymerase
MIYHAYSTHASILDFIRPLVGAVGRTLRLPWPLGPSNWSARKLAGVLETFADLMVTHVRPPFGIDSVDIDDCPVSVTEKAAYATPFATLLRFKKETGAAQPRVLLVAPMSGHFATLLRATARTMLVDHDVYITDWHNARDVPVAEGRFDFSDFVDHVIKFLRIMGPGTHVVAVCQPCVPVLAAAALMAQDGDAAQPRSMTLMAGPIDTRINPTKVNSLAKERSIEWFEKTFTSHVPLRYNGALREIYPGFMQLAAFLNMNLERHLRSFDDMAEARAANDHSKLKFLKEFYHGFAGRVLYRDREIGLSRPPFAAR